MAQTVHLTDQESEFAAACIDFIHQADPRTRCTIVVDGLQLKVPADPQMRRAFLQVGVKRLKKVLGLAASNGAIEAFRFIDLKKNLDGFDQKMTRIMSRRNGFDAQDPINGCYSQKTNGS